MKKWLIIAGALVLTACSSGSDNKSYYQLPLSAQSGAQSSSSQGSRLLWVEQVAVPDYLAGNGVVYQTSDVQYVIANNNLWASPLDQQLRNTLVANLSSLLNDISLATLNQGDSIHQMTRQLQALNQVSRQTDVLVSEASNASERLHQQSDLLLQAVSRFRLPA